MFVAVRAIAPVAGSPPNIGDMMFATPWPISSTFGLWRALVLGAESTADTIESVTTRHATGESSPSQPGTHPPSQYRPTKEGSSLGNTSKSGLINSTGA